MLLLLSLLVSTTLALTSVSILQEKFRNTLLVVSFNCLPYNDTEYPSADEVLRAHHRIYGHLFADQMIYVPWEEEEMADFEEKNRNHYHLPGHFVRAELLDDTGGLFGYKTMVHAIARMSGFGGYLYKRDDMVINMTGLVDLDANSIWAQGHMVMDLGYNMENANSAGWGWATAYGMPAMREVMMENQDMARQIRMCMGAKWHYPSGFADFLYIPGGEEAMNFRNVMSTFGRASLFAEIATPLFVRCFSLGGTRTVSTIYEQGEKQLDMDRMRDTCLVRGADMTLCHPVRLCLGYEARAIMETKADVFVKSTASKAPVPFTDQSN